MRKTYVYLILLAGLLIYLLTAFNSTGYYHPDEHFQILEFASYKLGNPNTHLSDLAWEYNAHIRPSAQVLLAYGIVRTCYAIGIYSPFTIATVLRLLSMLLSLGCLLMLYKAFRRELKTPFAHYTYILLSCMLWFMPYICVRFSSETWSGDIFFIALACLILRPQPGRWLIRLGIGMLLGLAFLFRYQSGFLIFGLLAWLFFIGKEYKQAGFYVLVAGMCITMLAGLCGDHWLYNEWVFSAWRYFKVNLIEGKAAEFGRYPWYFYFGMVPVKGIIPVGLLIILAVLWLWIKRPFHPLTWATLPFVLIHIIISHKELRFLFPLVAMVPLAISWLLDDKRFYFLRKRGWVILFFVLNVPLLIYYMFWPAWEPIRVMQVAHSLYESEHIPLVCASESPYIPFGLAHTFYKTEASEISVRITDPEQIRRHPRPFIYYTCSRTATEADSMAKLGGALIYQTFPYVLTEHANIFHWVERTTVRRMYMFR